MSRRQFVKNVQRAVHVVRSEAQRILMCYDKNEDPPGNILQHITKYAGNALRHFKTKFDYVKLSSIDCCQGIVALFCSSRKNKHMLVFYNR